MANLAKGEAKKFAGQAEVDSNAQRRGAVEAEIFSLTTVLTEKENRLADNRTSVAAAKSALSDHAKGSDDHAALLRKIDGLKAENTTIKPEIQDLKKSISAKEKILPTFNTPEG